MNFETKCPKLPWMIDFHSTEEGEVLNGQYKAAFADTTLEYLSALTAKSKPPVFRATRLACSIPPNVRLNTIEEVLNLGMNIARITATKNSVVRETLSRVKTINETFTRKIGRIYPLAIALEVRGPEIKTGQLKDPNKKIFLEKGQEVNLTTEPSYEDFVTKDMIFIDYDKLSDTIQPGDKILLDNGSVTLSAIECVESIIRCIVEKAGELISNASVSIPNAPLDLPVISASDKEIIEIAVGEHIDFLFVSGVYSKDGIEEIRGILGSDGASIQIITKIECIMAIDIIDDLIKVSDGICIDCEKLVMELPKEKVFIVQKAILAKCNLAGKPVMSSVLISDIKTISKPEVSDIANAVIDGSDGLLLAQDVFSKAIVQAVNTVCKEAEPAVFQKQVFNEIVNSLLAPMENIYCLAISAVEAASKSNAAAIVCLTSTGRTAKVLSRFRPRCPIIAISRYSRVARQLSLYKNVEPLIYLKSFGGDWLKDIELRIQLGVTYGKYAGYIRMGDSIVSVTASRPECGIANTVRVVYASDFDTLPNKNN